MKTIPMAKVDKGAGWTREAVLQNIQEQGNTVLLSFSRGKDSLAAWLYLRDHGVTVVPFHCLIVPDMQFVEDSLHYYEDFFGEHIYRVLHPNFYHWLQTLGFQTPEQAKSIIKLGLPRFGYEDVQRGVARTSGLPEDTWTAIGVRIADSLNRRLAFQATGPFNAKTRKVSVVFDMRKEELIETLKKSGVRLAQEYHWSDRSFDNFSMQFLPILRDHFPADYDRLLYWFPLVGLQFARLTIAKEHGYATE